MTKLNVRTQGKTPSQELIANTVAAVVVTTAAGSKITLKKPGVLSQFRLVRMLGDAAKNQVYVGMVMPLTYIIEIDGHPVAFPNSEREIEALITRLDENGVTTVMEGVQAHFGGEDAEQVQEEIKN